MELKECGHGHIYDASLYHSCPYCANRNRAINFEQNTGRGNSNSASGYGNEPDEIGKTIPVYSAFKRTEKEPQAEDTVHEADKPQSPVRTEPAAGWLVCLSGENRGKNYCLYEQNNYLDVTSASELRIGADGNISSDQVRIDYDRKHQDFYLLSPPASIVTAFLNGSYVDMPKKLNRYDVIELDNTKFIFVPFGRRRTLTYT